MTAGIPLILRETGGHRPPLQTQTAVLEPLPQVLFHGKRQQKISGGDAAVMREPEFVNTMPPATVTPALLMEPPLAFTPLTV